MNLRRIAIFISRLCMVALGPVLYFSARAGLAIPIVLIFLVSLGLALRLLPKANIAYKGVLLVLVPLLFLATFVGMTDRLEGDSESAQARSLRSKMILEKCQELLSQLAESESSLRGALITDDPAYSDEYERASGKALTTAADLQSVTSHNVQLRGEAAEIRRVADREILWSRTLAQYVRGGNKSQALRSVRAGTGKRLMDACSNRIAAFILDVRELDSERLNQVRVSWTRFHLLQVYGFLIDLELTALLALIFSRGISQRIAVLLQNIARMAKGEPLAARISGSDEIARMDQEFHSMSIALRQAQGQEHALLHNALEVICSIDRDGRFVRANPASLPIWGYAPDELAGRRYVDLLLPDDLESTRRTGLIAVGGTPITRFENRFVHRNGTVVDMLWSAHWSESDRLFFCVGRNITERKKMEAELRAAKEDLENRVEERTAALSETNRALQKEVRERARAQEQSVRQLERLSAQRAIHTAITASFDLQYILDVVLRHTIRLLQMDAATVFLIDPDSDILECKTVHGVRSRAMRAARWRLGEGLAGKIARECRAISIPDLLLISDCPQCALLISEGFRSYDGVPLVAKGQILGVIEALNSQPLRADADRHSFLETLAGQAAVAIENAMLLEDLRRSNVELVRTYDITLEGWMRALDLRDGETEGHTLRVAETTERLAQALGIDVPDLTHIRRGALLHDIGKIGIPDSILLKRGPLDMEETARMRLHPVYAYEWLSTIEFLKPALCIPYCHHERWDGTGYPQGLKGEEIPLFARVFTVADVWDALRSDRPYRPAMADQQVRDHLRESAGSHLDPHIVEVFLRMERSGIGPP